jgi:hypothetical protein
VKLNYENILYATKAVGQRTRNDYGGNDDEDDTDNDGGRERQGREGGGGRVII